MSRSIAIPAPLLVFKLILRRVMDRHKKKELGEYIDKAYRNLLEYEKFPGDTEAINECLNGIVDALYLIRSELKDDK
jgi:hypothetical protein